MNTESGFRASQLSAEVFGDEANELAGYRTLSGAAVASMLLGLASPLCVLGPMLLIVPVAGVAAALVAIRQTAGSDTPYIGRRAAWIGLILAVTCGFGSSSYAAATHQLRVAQARDFGKQWIKILLAGDTQQAFRVGTGQDVPKLTAIESGGPADPFKTLVERPAVKALLAAGAGADVEDAGVAHYQADWNGEFVVQQWFRITPRSPSSGGPPRPPFTTLVNLRRTREPGEQQASWKVADIALSDKVSEAEPGQ